MEGQLQAVRELLGDKYNYKELKAEELKDGLGRCHSEASRRRQPMTFPSGVVEAVYLGGGSYGFVCLGTLGSKPVAIKFFRGRREDALHALLKEGEALLRALATPIFPPLEGFFLAEGAVPPALIFKRCNLGSLWDVMRKDLAKGREHRYLMGPKEVLQVLMEIGGKLMELGKQGLSHRDIKMDNILVEKRNGCLHVYIGDSGLTIRVGLVGEEDQGCGCVQAKSPEEMCTNTVTEKSDCIALSHLIVAVLGGIGAETCWYMTGADLRQLLEQAVCVLPDTVELAAQLVSPQAQELGFEPSNKYHVVVYWSICLVAFVALRKDANKRCDMGCLARRLHGGFEVLAVDDKQAGSVIKKLRVHQLLALLAEEEFLREVPSEARKVLCAWNKVFLKGYCADLDIEMAGWVDPGLEVQDFGATLPKPLGDRELKDRCTLKVPPLGQDAEPYRSYAMPGLCATTSPLCYTWQMYVYWLEAAAATSLDADREIRQASEAAGSVFLLISNKSRGSAAANPYAYQDLDEVAYVLLTAAFGPVSQERCYFTEYDALTASLAGKAQAFAMKFLPRRAAAAAAGSLPALAITAGVAAALSRGAEQLAEYMFLAVRAALVLGEAKDEAAWKELVVQLAIIKLMERHSAFLLRLWHRCRIGAPGAAQRANCIMECDLAERALTKVLHDAKNSTASLNLLPTIVEACVAVAGGMVEERALELGAPPLLQHLGLMPEALEQQQQGHAAVGPAGLSSKQVQPDFPMEDAHLQQEQDQQQLGHAAWDVMTPQPPGNIQGDVKTVGLEERAAGAGLWLVLLWWWTLRLQTSHRSFKTHWHHLMGKWLSCCSRRQNSSGTQQYLERHWHHSRSS